MAPKPNSDQRRAEISLALGRLMATRGYDGASIPAIAKEAGLTPGLVHYHFASKADVLGDLVDRVVAVADQRMEKGLAGAATPRDAASAIVDAVLSIGPGVDREAAALWTQIGAEAVRTEEVARRYRAWVTRLVDRLDGAVTAVLADEQADPAASRAIALTVTALCEGSFSLAAAAPDLIEPGSAAQQARAALTALLDGATTPASGVSAVS